MNTRLRRAAATLAAGLLVAGLVDATLPASSSADTPIDFQVVGTTDVFDSGLMGNVIKKDFEAANPNITLTYASQGTGAALTSAKSGNYSALIVHAASLEKDFVAGGYSAEGPGRAIFWGDYVLIGPASDPAHVMSGGQPSNDAASAFEKIAAAGAAGTADFVSRGGTPGTTVQEHAIWALTDNTIVPKCNVADDGKQGGGAAPATGATVGQTCAATDMARSYPSWYHVNSGAGQAANIGNGNACAYPNAGNGTTPDCYVFTDRGTFNYLQSQGSVGQADKLQIVARDNAATARGTAALLVNSFHAYAIKHNAGDKVDEATAKLFLDFLTSPTEQARIGNYLGSGRSAAFIPSAAPGVSVSALPTAVPAGTPLTITGSISNVVPGTPALDGVDVTLQAQTGSGPVTDLATTTTNATGGFSFPVTVGADTTYSLRTPPITKVEDASLTPAFSDKLVASTAPLGTVRSLAAAAVTVRKGKLKHRKLTIRGTIGPAAQGASPTISILRSRPGKPLAVVASYALPSGASSYAVKFKLPKGKSRFQVQYSSGSIVTALSRVLKIRVR